MNPYEEYQGPSTYLLAYYQRKEEEQMRRQREQEYWNSPDRLGPKGPSLREFKEIDNVQNAIQTVLCGMKGEETRNSDGFCCRLVQYGVLGKAYEVLRRYEKLLANEPLVEKIADDWIKAGAFDERVEGDI